MAFFRCKKLESIPENLFANITKINDLSFTFKNCNKLTSIPHIRCIIKIV